MADKKTVAQPVQNAVLRHDDSIRQMFMLQTSLLDELMQRGKLPKDFLELWEKYLDGDADQEMQHWIEKFLHCIQDECSEILNWTPWKHWKSNQDPINIDEIKWEIIDIWHFVMNLSLLFGMGPEEFVAVYRAKNAENFRRQEDGY